MCVNASVRRQGAQPWFTSQFLILPSPPGFFEVPGINVLRCLPILSFPGSTQELPRPHERLKLGLRLHRGTPCSKISKEVLVPQVAANSVEGAGESVLEVMGFTKGTETFMHC